jgi:hypothetical protein
MPRLWQRGGGADQQDHPGRIAGPAAALQQVRHRLGAGEGAGVMAETSATVFLHLRPDTPVAVKVLKVDAVDQYVLSIGGNVSVIAAASDLLRIAAAITAGPADKT